MIATSIAYAGFCLYRQHRLRQETQARRERIEQLGLIDEVLTDADKKNYRVSDPDKPRLMTISRIGINNARIQEVGLLAPTSDGSQQMDAPRNIHDVGWYNCQINPVASRRCQNYDTPDGLTETVAVFDGHSCDGDGCVFDRLGELQSGDQIKIELGSGDVVTYVVDWVETVDLDKLDMSEVMSSHKSDRPGLNLITCNGSWTSRDSRGNRTMNQRTIVYSSLSE